MIFDFLFRKSQGFSFGIQGRYYFPLIVSHMALLIIGLTTLIQWLRLKVKLIKLIGVGMIFLSGYSWCFVVSSYYNTQSWNLFFIQASQYKPWFFKTPWLEFYVLFSFISTMILVWYYFSYEREGE